MKQDYYLDRIFKHLYFQGAQSSSELSHWLHKSPPSVTKLLNTLIDYGCVETNGFAPSTGGRRAVKYSIKKDFKYVVAVSMDQIFTTIAIFNLSHKKATQEETIVLDLHQTPNALEVLSQKINTYIHNTSIPSKNIIGVGIAMPGLIKPKSGMNCTFFNQNSTISHKDYLEKELNLPVFLDNDSSLTALAECAFGKAKGQNNAMIVKIGWGTGLGMIVNGKLFRGETGYAGEFSHIPISNNGKLCECGKRGCMETETSLLIMAEEAIKKIKEGEETGIQLKELKYMSDEIINAALNGNQFCINLLSKIGHNLGKGIAILIQIMNPGIVLLSGRGARAEKILKAPIEQALTHNCIPKIAENTQIAVSDLGLQAPLLGAAALVIESCPIQDIVRQTELIKEAL
ncbi:MAG TPA: ROK family transcriptional regulator [Chitinophagaceae bacterium]|nr:ROK family transcriptional regulator [Chitinophagaceae bacterium]